MDFASEADRAYANGAFIPGAEGFLPRWRAQAAAFRARALGQLGLAYGAHARQRFDLFRPEAVPRGVLVFVHGGYWMDLGREDWSHLAAGAVARGWACAIPSYTLAPEARIADMTLEIQAAVRAAARAVAALVPERVVVPGQVVVAGHSAGGHLAARMACEGGPQVARVVPISPIADLRPLLATEMAATLRLDAEEAAAQSPALLRPRAGVGCHVWVGGQERPAFVWQARLLAEGWGCPWTVEAGIISL